MGHDIWIRSWTVKHKSLSSKVWTLRHEQIQNCMSLWMTLDYFFWFPCYICYVHLTQNTPRQTLWGLLVLHYHYIWLCLYGTLYELVECSLLDHYLYLAHQLQYVSVVYPKSLWKSQSCMFLFLPRHHLRVPLGAPNWSLLIMFNIFK